MYQYTNSFTCAASQKDRTVMLQFRQKSPNISETGEIDGEKMEVLSMLMMDMETAQALGKALLEVKDGFDGISEAEPERKPQENQ